MTRKKKLTEKQKRFIDFYIKTGNATESARKAGYSTKYINTNANKLLQNTTVAESLAKRLRKLESERIADAKEVLQFLTSAMRGEVDEDVVVVEGIGKGYSEARVMRKQLSARERLDAAKQLAKRYALDVPGSESAEPVIIQDDVPDTEVKSHADQY